MRSTKKVTADLIIIGGGAAGMFAAGTAAERGMKVLVIEHSERLGKKLYITGKGRCNVTNHCEPREMLENIPRNSRFLYSSVYGFPPAEMMKLLEQWGCPLKTERGNRVFPVSDRAASVIDALRKRMEHFGAKVLYADATVILSENGAVTGVKTDRGTVEAPAVMLCTGGCSYPTTGSDGSGYRLVSALGHTVVPPVGSLVPLVERGNVCAKMQGLSLKNVSVKLFGDTGKLLYEDFGELLFTHFGLSGPVVLSASAHRRGEHCVMEIDLKPALDEEKLEARLLRDFDAAKNRELATVMSGLLPHSMIPVMLDACGIPGNTPVHSVTKQQRKALVHGLKHFSVPIFGPRPVDEAIVTSGGVRVEEINPKTMESKLIRGLFFAGEVMDVDAYTGGFNLQIAWSTAFAAACAAASACQQMKVRK